MKAKAPDMVSPIHVIRQSVKISVLRHRVVEGGVKNSHLRHAGAEHFLRCQNALDVVRVVERRQFDAFLNSSQDLISDQSGLRKQFATVDNSVPHGADVGYSLIFLDSQFTHPAQNVFQ